MPTYIYKAATSTGLVVRNRVEAGSKQSLIRILKSNDLMPISIEQVSYSSKRKKAKKRNIKDIEGIMTSVNTTRIKTKKGDDSKRKNKYVFIKNRKNHTKRFSYIYTELLSIEKSKL